MSPTITRLSLPKMRHRPLGSALPKKGRTPFWSKAPTRDHPQPSSALWGNKSTQLSPARTLLTLSFLLIPLSSFAAINASQTLILQTGGIERARLNTLGLLTNSISATEISTTVIKWGTRTQPTCNAAAKGQMLHTTSTTAPLQFCDGANWRTLTLDGGGSGTPVTCTGGTDLGDNTCRYDAEGEYTFTLPSHKNLTAFVWGAGGAGSAGASKNVDGGSGGFSTGTIPATLSNRTFRLVVGSGGKAQGVGSNCVGATGTYGGGGVSINQSGSGSGGGYSSIFIGTTAGQANTFIMAGGGGGAGGTDIRMKGGSGGGVSGTNGGLSGDTGATQLRVGEQGTGGGSQLPGPLLGGFVSYQVGGGGGYFGGGGATNNTGGGGGGSGYLHGSVTNSSTSTGSDRIPAATASPFYYASAGTGGLGSTASGSTAACGKPGLIVLLID